MSYSAENIALRIADFRGQVISSLLGGNSDRQDSPDFADLLTKKLDANKAAEPETDAYGLVNGRNPSLFDPESAYKMMSLINRLDVRYKAQYAELEAMGQGVEILEEISRSLGDDVDAATADAAITQRVMDFIGKYNEWIKRFAQDVAPGGLLDEVQAAEFTLHELEISIGNIFNGAASGIAGLNDLGIEIDPESKLASLNQEKFASMLAQNKPGVVAAIDEFSANFAKSADLLNSPNNFITNQLDNRDRAIRYISENLDNLRREFGTGTAAKPAGDVARALAAYEKARMA